MEETTMKRSKWFAASLILACAFIGLAVAQEPHSGSANQRTERVYKSSEVSRKVFVLSKPEPEYAEQARENKTEGSVILSVVLRADGEIGDIGVLKGLQDGLNDKAIEAARRIKFEPAQKDGRPVSQSLRVEYVFSL
jgi:TonB family protein